MRRVEALVLLCVLSLFGASVSIGCDPGFCPEQLRLSYHNDTTMMITWTTLNYTEGPQVVFWGTESNNYIYNTTGYTSDFFDYDPLFNFTINFRTTYIHRAFLKDLKPSTFYYYIVGSQKDGMSNEFQLKTVPSSNSPLRLAVFGDFGYANPQALSRLKQGVDSNEFDCMIHAGDFAYDLKDDLGRKGDAFLNMIQPLTSKIPYQTAPGNHELDIIGTFHQYKSRFSMPNYKQEGNMFYSYNLGLVHFVAINTEAYFDGIDIPFVTWFYEWLIDDLEYYSQHLRKTRPWLILYGHRPLYCSDTEEIDCTSEGSILRNGIDVGGIKWYGLEDVFYKYGVDLYIAGHEHNYERIFPVYKGQVKYNKTSSNPYENPETPVYLISGAAGCDELLANDWGTEPYSAYHNGFVYSISKMSILNETVLTWEQIEVPNGNVIDSITVVKDHHGPFP